MLANGLLGRICEDERERDLIGSTFDGFVTGSDVIGLLWDKTFGKGRSLGYNAQRRGLNYRILDGRVEASSLASVRNPPIQRDAVGNSLYCIAFTAGLALNISTLGLVNTFYLGEVYCLDENAKGRSR